ncbi:hypothetical protein DFJ58DRAFT_731443 [Suillus subalutaceus]|uniref:uncharacterized protein n=1 Tax=Suillus subalutaceus TaxID=48586 RepID=UPI001B868D2D|nr:uncharacterized protein DFJ58DRAFT_731443 [Suillus subalutaceus]KAG1843963.1 hypothetical protein DFJ58DRAFT_731443 [Suillus subalutaceus]
MYSATVSHTSGRAPPSAIPPHPIAHEGIFLLNVDDKIWQDIGLDDDGMHAPAWLLDEATRSGIHLQLEVDWCVEEETRLMQEWSVMQEWMFTEWEAIKTVFEGCGARADELLHICVVWKEESSRDPLPGALIIFQDDDDDESVGVEEESDKEG